MCQKTFNCPPSHVARGAGIFCSRHCQGAHRTLAAGGPKTRRPRRNMLTGCDALLARKKRYRENHLDAERARYKTWRENNKQHLSDMNRAWRAAHPEAGYAGVKRWRAKNPDLQAAAARAGAANRRAKAAGAAGHISRADVTALWERQPVCLHCGNGRGIDHIVAFRDGGSNTPGNIQNLCRTCNAIKEGRLLPQQVAEIRAALTADHSGRSLATQYGVSSSLISLIAVGKR